MYSDILDLLELTLLLTFDFINSNYKIHVKAKANHNKWSYSALALFSWV